MDQKEFNQLHGSCEKTAAMLAECTAEPMPLPERVKIALQERIENTAHTLYLAAKVLLHDAARLGYAFTG
jgi:hypothetical protein